MGRESQIYGFRFNFLSVFWIFFFWQFSFVFLPSRMTGNQLGHDILFLIFFLFS